MKGSNWVHKSINSKFCDLYSLFTSASAAVVIRPIPFSHKNSGISAESNLTPEQPISFDETVLLHTPMIQEDETDPLKKFFKK